MIKKNILNPNRIRGIERGFSFIPHRFLTEGFLASLDQREVLLYFLLVLVSDRQGLSFNSYDAICSLLQLSVDDYIGARDGLIEKDLIAFDGTLFQVRDLPAKPPFPVRREQSPRQLSILACPKIITQYGAWITECIFWISMASCPAISKYYSFILMRIFVREEKAIFRIC